jgi:peptidoglycan/xylan/chitin deacetylase (PgdA/CDA1 family)
MLWPHDVTNAGRQASLLRRRARALLRLGVVVALAIGFITLLARPAEAAAQTKVSLAFDGDNIAQYSLGYQQALQPYGAKATFFVNSGSIGATNAMTWTQLSALAAAGDDVGGKTVNATNLTTDPNPTAQVCNDRAALLQHGLAPVAFAYPGGSTNSSVKTIVRNCGYGNARTAGGLSPTGPTYAETIPPADWLATRAYAPSTLTLANMQSLVSGAASHTGGWVQIVIGRVCSQALDPNNYTSCSSASGHIELADLNAFLDWVANAGGTGGAPAGATLSTVRDVVVSADTSTPATTIACNGAPCASTPYSGAVSITLAATDTGSGIASTHYTTDGSDPTLSSPTYTSAFNVNSANGSVTVKFRSWDYAGNVEATNTQAIQAPADSTPPTTTIACNGAACANTPYVETVSVSLSATDSDGAVANTYYTTDGSTPTTSSTVYSGPFQLSTPGTCNVQFFSTDVAGNVEQVHSQQIQVAPAKTAASLTFDNGAVSQYTLGYQKALQPHSANATFFVNSGTISVGTNIMTWTQLSALAAAGNDIGGKSVNSTNLTTDPNPTSQVCDDRTALVQHGLTPVAFAYPGGASNTTVKGIVKNCGYGSARSASGLSPAGATYAETLPPADWYATRAYAPTGQVTLANMQALVSGAASHHGGLVQIVIGRVCSQAQDPNNYTACIATAGWVDLADLNAFLDWMGSAGQSGGAPAGAALSTVRNATVSADTAAPVTSIACNGAACASSVYSSTVYATLSATDVGSAVASTHYTTDGSDPTLSSPTYSAQIPLTTTTTIKFRSWDNAGNVEAVNTQVVQVSQPPDSTAPTTAITCDGATCAATPYTGKVTVTLSATDNTGGWGVDKTYYTTDGTVPTTASQVYSGPFTLTTPGTITVRFFSTDLAGNAEQPQLQQIQLNPYKTAVALTFDDQYKGVYTYLRPMLRAHGMNITIYTITSDSVSPFPCCMSYAQLRTMQSEGDDVGGHGRDHLDLTDPNTTYDQKVADVCNGRQDLLDNGIYDPVSYAYPFGKYNAAAEAIVQSCGFATARQGGGLASTTTTPGPRYADTLPPQDPYAMRAIDVDAPNAKSLTDMQNFVSAAASNAGGLLVMTFHEVCDQTSADYSSCMSTWSAVDTSVLGQFLDWLGNAGQSGGAPAGVSVQTVRGAINTPDTTPPSTTALCDGTACQGTPYGGSVRVSLSASDPGGIGVRKIYYTTDGSTPTTSSAVYDQPLIMLNTTTVKFFAVDNAGNQEAVETAQIQVGSNPDPVIASAGDIACDPTAPAFNGGNGTATDCRAKGTSNLLVGADAVLPVGDDQYNCGGYNAFQQSYDPTWGRFKSITRPVPGDKEYATSGGTDCPSTPGAGYFQYFGSAAGDPATGYYSYNLGSWHIVAINTGPCDTTPGFCTAGSAQDQWLQQDLAANTSKCTLAYYQNPRFASSSSGGDAYAQAIWQDLYSGGADVVFNGDAHWYERFAPMDASGKPDPTYGVREFIVGTGGAGLMTPGTPLPTSQVLDNSGHGVIQMTLHDGSYTWTFLHDTDTTFTDSGSANCHAAPDATPPTTTISCNGASCSSGWYGTPVQATLTATDNAGGSGVDKTYYTTDGSTPTTSSAVYTGPLTVSSTTTVKFFSTDLSGNAGQVGSQLIQVDTAAPTTTISCNGAACSSGWYPSAVQVALTATDPGGAPVATYYTTDGSTPTTSSPTYSGPFTLSSLATVKFFSVSGAGNTEAVNSQLIQIDVAAPSTAISCNGAACSSGWYGAAVQATLTATDNAGGSGVDKTYYTTNGSTPTTSSMVYTGPFTVSQTTTVKFFSTDLAGNAESVGSQLVQVDTAAPTTTISCNGAACSSGWYRSAVQVGLTATDPGGAPVATFYTTDGSTPTTSSTVYSGPFTLSATATVKFFSMSGAGNTEAVNSQLIQIDAATPTTAISCNGGPCSSGWYATSVMITLSASDNSGGSGVSAIYYTTDGSTPTTASTSYTGPFTVLGTATVKFFSVDVAGNTEAVKSQLIQIDTMAPTTTPSCNSATCSTGWYTANVQVRLTATDNTGGSGVSRTYYTTNGSTPTTSSTVYTTAFTVSSTTTVKVFSVDVAGNAEAVKSQLIQIDKTTPTTTISCNGAACSTGWYRTTPVTATLTGTDNSGGSGVSKMYYTTNGSTPTTSSTVYTGAFTVSATATVKFFSVDVAGNAEAVKSQLIQIDAAAPTVSITSPATGSKFAQGTTVSITATATDVGTGSGTPSGIASVTFYLDGTTVIATDKSSPYTASWNTKGVTKTTHTLTAVATDVAGNSTTSTAISVTIT